MSEAHRGGMWARQNATPVWITEVSTTDGVTVTRSEPVNQPNVVRAGNGRRRINPDGMPYVRPEFPEGGDPRFRAVLAEMLSIHISKSSDYGTGGDIYANYRAAEAIGVSAWKSCFIRALEKVQRLTNAANGKKLNHEGISDSFLDLANHLVISKVLYDEAQQESEA